MRQRPRIFQILRWPIRFLSLVAIVLVVSPGLSAAPTQEPSPTATPLYQITDLGPLPMASTDAILSLSNSGKVGEWLETDGVVHAALWENGKAKDLGTPKGYISSVARAVNSQGQAVGWATTSNNLVDSLATTHACLYDVGGKVFDLGTLGGRDSQAYGINSHGQIVGGSLRADGVRRAFLYKDGKMSDLGTLPGGKFSLAYAISDTGSVVGIAETSQSVLHACLWKQGKVIDLGSLPNGHISLGFAINNKDIAAGAGESESEYHAVIFTQGKVQDLGTLETDPASVSGLNNLGQAVGASSISEVVRHAFLWDSGKMTDLNKLIPHDSHVTLLSAAAINDHGQIICIGRLLATATQHDAASHAILLTPVARSSPNSKTPCKS